MDDAECGAGNVCVNGECVVDGGGQCPNPNDNTENFGANPQECAEWEALGMNSGWCVDPNTYFNDECGCGCR